MKRWVSIPGKVESCGAGGSLVKKVGSLNLELPEFTERADTSVSGKFLVAGAYEDDPHLDREGYRGVIELLRELGVGSSQ